MRGQACRSRVFLYSGVHDQFLNTVQVTAMHCACTRLMLNLKLWLKPKWKSNKVHLEYTYSVGVNSLYIREMVKYKIVLYINLVVSFAITKPQCL